ncbi:hypothetical protein [Bacillus marinisedimentorum]|uniref:hypothetical protein n=1 Tax=Bacillus marinisedimentorum TaxID=1821260 RepID=UPI000872EB92|nr:hypothetical protein [Bacillus marinisedimentorum]
MILAYGITGGYKYPGEPERPQTDKNAFIEECKSVADEMGIEAQEYKKVWGNFYAVEFKMDEKSIFAVLNACHPVMAFADYDSFGQLGSGYRLNFIDESELSRAFCHDYLVLSKEDLEEPFVLKNQPQLRDIESVKEKVKYYNPKTIGDVIFNCWD